MVCGQMPKDFLFVCFYLKKKLRNMEWNLLMQMQGRMQVMTRLEYEQNAFELQKQEKWRCDEGQGQLPLEITTDFNHYL